MQLRDYQQQTVDSLFDYLHYDREGAPIAVLPTGAGKSVCISSFIEKISLKYPEAKFIVLSHVKEILEQNYQKIVNNFKDVSAGIFCAGLGKKELDKKVVFASVQSLYSSIEEVDKRNIVIIDECHLVNAQPDSMYMQLLNRLKELNPKTRFIGFTATPFRVKEGMLTEGKNRLFTDIPIEIPILPLVKQGYLSPLSTKISYTQANLDDVSIRGGEYKMDEAAKAMTEDDLEDRIVRNIIENGKGRKRWLIFCCNVKHAEEVSIKLNEAMQGVVMADGYVSTDILSLTISGETPTEERDDILNLYRNSKSKGVIAITNCNVLTTGFDAPNIDLIAFLRPTKSLSLYIQMVGRGMRIEKDKKDCLILDYAGNVEQFGPINHIDYRQLIKRGAIKQKSCKRCPQCEEAVKPSDEICGLCGHVFEKEKVDSHIDSTSALTLNPAGAEVLSEDDQPEEFWFNVKEVNYFRHEKVGKIATLKVEYSNMILQYSEWVCIEHSGFAGRKAADWWEKRANNDQLPLTITEALDMVDGLMQPKRIMVKRAGKYWRIINYDFKGE